MESDLKSIGKLASIQRDLPVLDKEMNIVRAISYWANADLHKRNESAQTKNSTTTYSTHQNNISVNGVPITPLMGNDHNWILRQDINVLLVQFLEWLRVTGESRRIELLYRFLSKESNETSDLFGKIIDIAQRITHGERVTQEEMFFLAKNSPQLFYIFNIMRDETTGADEIERKRWRERRRRDRRHESRRNKDRRSESRKIGHIYRNYNQVSTFVPLNISNTQPINPGKQIRLASLKVLYNK